MKAVVAGKSIEQWKVEYPLIDNIIKMDEVFWLNPSYTEFEKAIASIDLGEKDVLEAEERLKRFAPYIAQVFPETRSSQGLIESPLVRIPQMQAKIDSLLADKIAGELLLKCDNKLAISGSIKARGGIYEVLKHAEDLALANNLLTKDDNYAILNRPEFKEFYSQYAIAVGSTGNLGLSIGIMSAQLGFKVYVHMSADAKKWKKDLLRSKGVTVIEYNSDFSKAVTEGRKQAEADPDMYFIDDENSRNLFLGYAVAAKRLQRQLESLGIRVDSTHPLYVYLPCGVGGGPGGVAFGLKLIFKDNVHCFFVEPTHSPCMLLGMMTGLHNAICVQDFGIDNLTCADGLAVGRASGFVGRTLHELISGIFTIKDEKFFRYLKMLVDAEDIFLEPSALAGLAAVNNFFSVPQGQDYLIKQNHLALKQNITHIAWATGGSMVPEKIRQEYYQKGLELFK